MVICNSQAHVAMCLCGRTNCIGFLNRRHKKRAVQSSKLNEVHATYEWFLCKEFSHTLVEEEMMGQKSRAT